MTQRLILFLAAVAMIAGCAQPERKLLATWYVVADPLPELPPEATQEQRNTAEEKRTRTLYLGLLNAGETSITIKELVLNEFLPRRTPNEYKTVENPLKPGTIQFIRLGSLSETAWQCRLPASVAVVGTDGEGHAIELQAISINVMPTSIPQLWRDRCTYPRPDQERKKVASPNTEPTEQASSEAPPAQSP
jgi:hypothetical protein